jgi:hypothetical protein
VVEGDVPIGAVLQRFEHDLGVDAALAAIAAHVDVFAYASPAQCRFGGSVDVSEQFLDAQLHSADFVGAHHPRWAAHPPAPRAARAEQGDQMSGRDLKDLLQSPYSG